MKSSRIVIVLCLFSMLVFASCMGSKLATSANRGGEVTGVGSGKGFSEPAPYGMVQVKRGFLKMGLEKQDSLWGKQTPVKEISVDGFWMDETEVTNSKYKQFVYWVRDSIAHTLLGDAEITEEEKYGHYKKYTKGENEGEIMSKNGEIAKEVFDAWDGCCTDEDFYRNCMETICDIIGHKSGPIPDQAYDIWNIIDKIYL